MRLSFDVPYFHCPPDMKPYLQKVFDGEYEVPLIYAKEQPVVLDLGANCGAFAIWATHRWPGCKVHAFEPHPETFKYLEANVRQYGNIYAHKYAVGEAGLRVLHNGPNNCGESSLHLMQNMAYPTGQHVEVTDPLSMPRDARILKMDIEGCEMEVLEPLIRDGRKFDAIMLEYHNADLRREVDALLSDYYLTNSLVTKHGLGVVCYMRKELLA